VPKAIWISDLLTCRILCRALRAYLPTNDLQFYPVGVGHLLSILAMIPSASDIASAMADSGAGERRPEPFCTYAAAELAS
jgi:hypothetical protein